MVRQLELLPKASGSPLECKPKPSNDETSTLRPRPNVPPGHAWTLQDPVRQDRSSADHFQRGRGRTEPVRGSGGRCMECGLCTRGMDAFFWHIIFLRWGCQAGDREMMHWVLLGSYPWHEEKPLEGRRNGQSIDNSSGALCLSTKLYS